jgi:hypothetical protein
MMQKTKNGTWGFQTWLHYSKLDKRTLSFLPHTP